MKNTSTEASTEIKIFENEAFGAVRTTLIDGEPWFVGKDVAEILCYRNPSEALLYHVDDEDKLSSKTLSSFELDLGQRGGWLINESGLYSLILKSKLETAKQFKRWVTSEVLPSLRKHGHYGAVETRDSYMIEDSLERARKWMEEEMIRRQLLEQNSEQQAMIECQQEVIEEKEQKITDQTEQIEEMQPKVTYYDLIMNNPGLIKTTIIAKDYGWSATKLNKILCENKVQYKQGSSQKNNPYVLYQKYADKGYAQNSTTTFQKEDGEVMTYTLLKWTQKGRKFIYDLLKGLGFLPIVEREQNNHA